MFPPDIQKIISSYQILGVLPLDKFLHFVVGAALTIALRSFKVRMRWIFLILTSLAVAKEINDSYVLNSSLEEHILDTVVTLLYPLMIMGILKIKARAESAHSK